MRMRFQVMLAFRHGVSLSVQDARSIASAFWLSGAEAPASSVASASCYRRSENVFVLAVIVTELEFRKVRREILLGDMVETAHDAPLEQTPKAFDVVGMNLAANILAVRVFHR